MKLSTLLSTPLRRAMCLLLTTALFTGVLVHAESRHVDKRVPPVYPELARRMHVTGTVHISATVAPDGSVTGTKPVNGNAILTGAAEEAVRKWVFAPADTASTETVEIDFESTN
jgi:TonB family protein